MGQAASIGTRTTMGHGTWDHDAGGIDRDLNNDGISDDSGEGVDQNPDNDGVLDE